MTEQNPGTPDDEPRPPAPRSTTAGDDPPAAVDPWKGMTGSWTHPAPSQWTPPADQPDPWATPHPGAGPDPWPPSQPGAQPGAQPNPWAMPQPGAIPPPGAHQPPPGYPPPGYPPPGYPQMPPGYGPPVGHYPYAQAAYGAQSYAQLPAAFYAGPNDPLVSSDFSGWWNKSFRLLRAAWRPIAVLQIVSAIPQIVFLVLLDIRTNDLVTTLNSNAEPTTAELRALFDPYLGLLLPLLIALLVGLVSTLASLQLLIQQATGQPLSIGTALRAAVRRAPALIGWCVPAMLMVGVGLLFCLLPGIYLAFVFAVLSTVVLLERGNAIGRVFALFHADFGASLARVVVAGGIAFALNTLADIITRPIAATAGASTTTSIVTQTIAGLIAVVGATLTIAMMLTAYADMRARHEPFSTAYLQPQTR
ncbi:hypothetical protein GCM10010172_11100 [Paractinoplanes ferrugineus]|uniref:Uncharacterized protein n=1 Tax=Paractinoplanes ferrugineus TaxID=113564 RepID=A0A919IWX7_9ACTN|nr:hypothetical protein [Actinoplanes ferrugineus]GIE09674.1 hypothetical protein Afe05nite_15140 [Actinoplanes ferrugineus]